MKRQLTFDFFGKIASASQFIELESGGIRTEVFGEDLVDATAVWLIGHFDKGNRDGGATSAETNRWAARSRRRPKWGTD